MTPCNIRVYRDFVPMYHGVCGGVTGVANTWNVSTTRLYFSLISSLYCSLQDADVSVAACCAKYYT